MKKKYYKTNLKNVSIGGIVTGLNMVDSMKWYAHGNVTCLFTFLYEKPFIIKLIFGKLFRTQNLKDGNFISY